jgi:hypothetical protein
MITGHHRSRTSSRLALLDAVRGVGVRRVVPTHKKYGTVVLPDGDIISELQSRGQVFRTDTNDAACAANPSKIGPDNDGHAGGCDKIRLVIGGTPAVQTAVFHGAD